MDQVEQIREKIDIVSFISEYVPLKKAGRNFKANCPFHTEKTPSFIVSPERQTWHCFGSCSKGGDVYSFLMEYERLEFPESLRLLAKRAGIELSSRQFDSSLSSQKERLYRVNSLAKEFYHFILLQHPAGKRALAYLQNRGVSQKVIETFQLGFSPGSGDALVKYLVGKKRFTKEDVIDAGLVFAKGEKLIDFFRSRLMFPLIDHRDNVLGFSGRILEPGNIPSKYINTRETPVYHKSDHVFGIQVTKEAIRRKNQTIILEGEFDVLSCFQNGIANVVAMKGTALTENQVNLLARFSQKITFCFDADSAGQAAIKRSLGVVEKKGLSPTVIEIPNAKDPDEALQNEPGLFKKAVREDIGIYDYLLTQTLASIDRTTAKGKKHVSDSLLPIFAHISNEIIKEHYLRKLSSELETTYESIAKELQRLTREVAAKSIKLPSKTKRSKEEIMEEYLLSLILQSSDPKLLLQKAVSILSDSITKDRACQKIMHLLIQHFEHTDVFDSKLFADGLGEELISTYDTCLLFPLPPFESENKITQEVEKIAAKLKSIYIQQEMKKLAEEIKQQEQAGMEDSATKLKILYSSLISSLDPS